MATDEKVRYQPVRELGRGMFGVVSLALTSDGRRVIVKRLESRRPLSPTMRRRFCLEAEAMRRVSHPNVMPVLDVRADCDPPFFVMPLLDGATLGVALRKVEAELPLSRVAAVLRDVAHALRAIHERGLVHRDVKPDNLFVRKTGETLLFDFGLVKETHGAPPDPLTAVGEIIGTPAYMSPEQIRGEEITGACDVYAFGVLASELLLGKNPFLHDEVVECIRKHLFTVPEPLDRSAPRRVSPDLARLVARCLEKDPARRPTSIELSARMDQLRARITAGRTGNTRPVAIQSTARAPTSESRRVAPAGRGEDPAAGPPAPTQTPRPAPPLRAPSGERRRPDPFVAMGRREDPPSTIERRPARNTRGT